jgi:O-methyltransferase
LTVEIKNRNDPFEIIAYTDNDPKLQGTILFDKPVIHPSKIASYNYDQIIIAAMDTHNITKQLIDECGVKPDVINGTLFSRSGNNNSRIIALKNSAQLICDNNIAGSVAELGVFQGDFAKHINVLFPDRTLYLFDTFEGFYDSDVEKEKEIGTKRIFERSYNYAGTSIELVLSKMKNPEKCVMKKGFFPETAKGFDDQFAFVSLDADLYHPMLEGLKYFYPRLSKGGFIFIHDFFTDAFTGTRKAVLEYKNDVDIKFIPLGDDCSVVITK